MSNVEVKIAPKRLDASEYRFGLGGLRFEITILLSGYFLLWKSGSGSGDGQEYGGSYDYEVYKPEYSHQEKKMYLVKVGEAHDWIEKEAFKRVEQGGTMKLNGEPEVRLTNMQLDTIMPRLWKIGE